MGVCESSAMSLEMSYYKIIGKDGKSSQTKGNAKIGYSTEHWTEAPEWLSNKGYYPTIFSNLENAQDFQAGYAYQADQIWEVEAEMVMTSLPPICSLESLKEGNLIQQKYWTWPKGTLMAKKVRLVRIIENNEKPKCLF